MLLGPIALIIASAIMFAGATVLSTVGFGIGMTATPFLLMWYDPRTVVVVINTVSLVLFVLIIVQSREHLRLREMTPIGVAGLMGVPVGVFILSFAADSVLRISITGLIILLTAMVAFNVRGAIPLVRLMGPIVGFVVGMLLTSLGIGGPLMALFLLARDWPRQSVRVALSFYFLLVEFTGVVGYAVAGLFTPQAITLVIVTTVPVLLGFWVGSVLVRRMNERVFHHAVVVVILATSVAVLAREVVSL